jgi:hypothetical protein
VNVQIGVLDTGWRTQQVDDAAFSPDEFLVIVERQHGFHESPSLAGSIPMSSAGLSPIRGEER